MESATISTRVPPIAVAGVNDLGMFLSAMHDSCGHYYLEASSALHQYSFDPQVMIFNMQPDSCSEEPRKPQINLSTYSGTIY